MSDRSGNSDIRIFLEPIYRVFDRTRVQRKFIGDDPAPRAIRAGESHSRGLLRIGILRIKNELLRIGIGHARDLPFDGLGALLFVDGSKRFQRAAAELERQLRVAYTAEILS